MRRIPFRVWLSGLGLLLVSAGLAAGTPGAGWRSAEAGWRAEHARQLAQPAGWLTLVGLDWLTPGENAIGTAAGTQVHLGADAGASADRLGSLVLAEGKITLRAPRGGFPAGLREDGAAPHEGPVSLDDDHPTRLTVGSLTMIVIQRGDRFAVRTKDANAPARTGFRGLHWYAPDPRYVVTAKWTPYQPVHMLRIPTVLGTTIEMPSPGAAAFTIDGQAVRLEPVLESPDARQLFFILRDRTGRTTTDGAARFLYTGLPDHGLASAGSLVLDLNHLENPPCAYTPYATCPLPPPQNRLAVALPAGEQRYVP